MASAELNTSLIDINMPALGADMHDGTLIEWQVKPGDKINKGDIIAVIETSKGAIDMEAYHSGIITELLVEPGIKLPVGSVLARMSTTSMAIPVTSEAVTSEAMTSEDRPIPSKPVTATQAATNIVPDDTPLPPYRPPRSLPSSSSPPRQRVSPAARQQALHRGIDLATLTGSGPQRAIILRDIPVTPEPLTDISIVEQTTSDTAPQTPSPMRQAISDAMSRSKREIPHYYLALDIDLTAAQHWLGQQNQQREPERRLLLPAVLIAAIARQLRHFPALNGAFSNGAFTPSQAIHIGNTISLREGGLVTPAILHADQLSIDQTMDALRDLTERSRHGRLRSSEVSEATITVTSIGDRGADSITGVIYPPQVTIIGLGRLRQAAIVTVDGELAIGQCMTVTLAADHRVSDGITGARFLHALAKQLQHPEAL
ncbi:dihydrolipoamide acetyltransferase family protein [Photobacterium nomapromontoriensis]|uniref:dihydrolipoamide acetyltransferase family protein n=1 Tax=Photobacterium nomapromontoriensis TaxID=2910237 RepID=UPI003D13CEB8